MGEYRLSAGAILYSVFLLHKRSIYGVPAVMPSIQDRKFPLFAQEAEQELMDSGCGVLDFDGVFSLDPDFSTLLKRCADCREVLGASLRRGGRWHKLTIYQEAGALLEHDGNLSCALRPIDSPEEALLEALALPDAAPGQLQEVCVDTGLLEKKNLAGIQSAGCSETQAKLILDALTGDQGYAHVVHTKERERLNEMLLLYGPEGILTVGVEYTETQELMRLTPLTEREAAGRLRVLAKTKPEQEDVS